MAKKGRFGPQNGHFGVFFATFCYFLLLFYSHPMQNIFCMWGDTCELCFDVRAAYITKSNLVPKNLLCKFKHYRAFCAIAQVGSTTHTVLFLAPRKTQHTIPHQSTTFKCSECDFDDVGLQCYARANFVVTREFNGIINGIIVGTRFMCGGWTSDGDSIVCRQIAQV